MVCRCKSGSGIEKSVGCLFRGQVINGTEEVTEQCVTEDDVSRRIQEKKCHVVKDRLPASLSRNCS